MKPKNVFGQPLVPATLRAAQSPQLTHKNKVEEDLRKLLIVDDVVKNHRKVTVSDLVGYRQHVFIVVLSLTSYCPLLWVEWVVKTQILRIALITWI